MADGPSDVEALLTVPPDEFVAARNALVKSLRGAGRKDDAAAVAALRRPSVVDWALNTVASESPDVVGTVSHAASRLRQASGAPGRSPARRPVDDWESCTACSR